MDDRVRKAVEKATVKNASFKAMHNDPSLHGKLRAEVGEAVGKHIYWYIKFNIPLDPESVTKDAMNIMETNGYILDALITYDDDDNTIVICPIDPYEENEFYILTILRKVKSAKGTPMKKDVHILFKIIEERIAEYKILKDSIIVPKPRPKPKSAFATVERLPAAQIKINFWLGLLGVLMIVAGIIVNNPAVLTVSLVVAGAGVAHIIAQLGTKKKRSQINYLFGSGSFHKGDYMKARRRFQRAVKLDPHNEYAELALNKLMKHK